MSTTIHGWSGIQTPTWMPVLQNNITFGTYYKIVPTEGYLAWEYNPLRNYRLSQNMYEKDGKYYTWSEFVKLTGTSKDDEVPDGWTLREAGELVDFITGELSFNLEHPVEILPQYSYDGSVNLIINDGLNIPRLINSRFTTTGKNTYKVIDRKGDNDTNIYDQGEQFDVDTSLFKNVNKIPKLEYLGTANGNMSVGNYHFYFKYSDADGNESDWVAESGLVSVFMGNTPQSVNTGLRDENSLKSVHFRLSNIDIGYSFVKVYYTRYSADVDSNLIVQAKRIDKNFLVNNSGICNILINGDENETDVTLEDINSSFDVIQNAKTQCTAANRLFMANIHKSKVEYDKLSKLSLCFCPYKHEEAYPLIDSINETYEISAKSDGYYDSKYIYDKTGYWPGELYRIGVVYILKDGSLSPVFNIRGATNLSTRSNNRPYSIEEKFANKDLSLTDILSGIEYSEENYMIVGGTLPNENAKGIIQLSTNSTLIQNKQVVPFPVLGIEITANKEAIKELKKYVKGFFFVRQKRMPITLSQGLVIGLDNESNTPTLPTIGGVLADLDYNKTFIETSDINDINYVSEGFLTHYRFKIERKKLKTGAKIGIALAAIVVLAAAVVATVFTCGAAGVAIGAGVAAISLSMSVGSVTLGAVIGFTAAAAAVTAATAFAISDGIQRIRQERNKAAAQALVGRNEPIPKGYERNEQDDSRKIDHDLNKRYVIKDPSKNKPKAVIIPDYQVNQPYYNQLYTGDTFTVQLMSEQPSTNFLSDGFLISKERHFYVDSYLYQTDKSFNKVKLVGVPDGCPIKMIGDNKFRARAGYPEEAYKYEFQGMVYEDPVDMKDNSDIVRGNFGSYVGMEGYTGHATDQIEVKIPGYTENSIYEYIQLRAQDTSAFYAISDRIDIKTLESKTALLSETGEELEDFNGVYFRGDSYICQYTHRIIRNFNDPSAPYNDVIVDSDSWRKNYNPNKPEEYANINLGDVNAVQMGLWVTFQLRSSYNLNVRTIDKSNVDEYLMCGNYRSFYPNYGQVASGSQKIPDSDQYNKGFSKSVSEKYYFEVPEVPYIKQEFQNRIVFSDIHINDAYKNGFRVLRTVNHKDYPMTYGSITKLIELKNALLIVFEHGVGLVAIDNNTDKPSQVLSDLNIISDTYGSQWKDSVIKTPSGVYGVDTVAKKIWRVKEGQIELISDFHVQEFLNQNISLSERELTPILGIRNVKTCYNAFKHDVMFTFYDNLYGTHEKSWNLCWNEILGIFTTFYSWIPGQLENIDNIPFSFDRDTIKAISKLGMSDYGNDFSEGITLTNNVIDTESTNLVVDKTLHMTYLDKQGKEQEYEFLESDMPSDENFIGFLQLKNRLLLDNKTSYNITYELLRDSQGNHKLFEICSKNIKLKGVVNTLVQDGVEEVQVSWLKLTDRANLNSEIYYRNKEGHAYADWEANKVSPLDPEYSLELPIFKNTMGKRLMLPKNLQINPDKVVRYLNVKAKISMIAENAQASAKDLYYNQFANSNQGMCMIDAGYFESSIAITTKHNLSLLYTDFWKHGQGGIIDISDKIYPTYWYGKQHPFEFECVVVDDPSVHKIFTNLELVANKTKPESFHYEVVGDVYDFADDKPTMYFRQEALKALYQYNGYDIEYNPNFLEIEPKQHNRSADLPKYYSRWDTINEIYDSYKRFDINKPFNYDHLAGAEIVYYPTRNEFRVWNHAEAIDVDSLSQDLATSVIKANCRYLEDKWLVSINPIIVTYKNEIDKSKVEPGTSMFSKDAFGVYKYSSWVKGQNGSLLPPINIQGTKMEETSGSNIEFPSGDNGKDNSLYGLYDLTEWNKGSWRPIDPTKNSDRRETDVRGKFMKVRIRYSGEELAIIDFLNTIYQISFA